MGPALVAAYPEDLVRDQRSYPLKVLHVTPSFHPAYVYGGTTRSVYDLCRNVLKAGCEVKVLTTDANGPDAVLEVDTRRETILDNELVVRYCHRVMDVSVSPR